MKCLIVLDVDSTFIEEEVIDLLAQQLGVGAQVAAITDRAMAGELDFADSLRERAALLAGLAETNLDQLSTQVRLSPGAAELARVATASGHVLALVSGGFTRIIAGFAGPLGINNVTANTLAVADGRLTGEVIPPLIDRAGKAAALQGYAEEFNIPMSATVAVGDGANDIDMVRAAAVGIGFRPKPALAAEADVTIQDSLLEVLDHLPA